MVADDYTGSLNVQGMWILIKHIDVIDSDGKLVRLWYGAHNQTLIHS